jgi:RNA-binding protein
MKLTGKERAELRADANKLRATVHVGAAGLGRAIVATLDDALRTHELVKVQMTKQVDVPAKVAARQLAEATGSDVVQVIGRTTTLYRHNPELKRKPGALPPWK